MTRRDRGSALIVFALALVLLLAIVAMALEAGTAARVEEGAAKARALAREAAEAGASQAFMKLRSQFRTSDGFTTSISTSGGNLGWTVRQPFNRATWQVWVVDNDDGDGNLLVDSDYTCILYVTGRAACSSGPDEVVNLTRVIRAVGGQVFPAWVSPEVVFGGTPSTVINVKGALGSVQVNGRLTMNPGLLSVQKTIGYGELNPAGGTMTSAQGPGAIGVAPPVALPSITAAQVWSQPSLGDKYQMMGNGDILKNGVFLVNASVTPWSGWSFNGSGGGNWTHAAGAEFAPLDALGNPTAATFYTDKHFQINGGPVDALGNPLPRSVTLIDTDNFYVNGPINIYPATPGVTLFSSDDLIVAASNLTLGSAASPGYVFALDKTSIAGSNVNVFGSVLSYDTIALGSLSGSGVTGTITITNDKPPAFIVGTPVLKTILAYQGSGGVFPLDAAQGPLGKN